VNIDPVEKLKSVTFLEFGAIEEIVGEVYFSGNYSQNVSNNIAMNCISLI